MINIFFSINKINEIILLNAVFKTYMKIKHSLIKQKKKIIIWPTIKMSYIHEINLILDVGF